MHTGLEGETRPGLVLCDGLEIHRNSSTKTEGIRDEMYNRAVRDSENKT